jgi:hypothetical protein
MRFLTSLCSFLLTLIGCHPQPGTTTLTFSSVDGVGINSTKARIADGQARFECLKSASGKCHYVVFLSDCAPSAAAPGACATTRLQQFTLAAGEAREITGLPAGIKHCFSHERMPMAPDCGVQSAQP